MQPGPDLSDEALDNLFTYHPATDDQRQRYVSIRVGGKGLAKIMRDCCPPSAERTVAIRKVREAVMYANAAIACNEPDANG